MLRPDLELLAPARDADIGIEAVNHGADAVYIGGPGFGARDKAPNTIEDIGRLVRHAHRFGARIFVTMNTILRDDELEGARQQAWQLYEAGEHALRTWAGRVERWRRDGDVYAYFNDDWEGHALREARRLRALVDGA